MTEAEEITMKLRQNEADRQALQAKEQALYREANKLEEQLVAAEKKVELRHGDYGQDPVGPWIHAQGKTYWNCDDGKHESGFGNGIFIKTRLGNIFDDLKRNSEDLEEFEVMATGAAGQGFKAQIIYKGRDIYISCRGWRFSTKEYTEIIQKLNRLKATVLRKQQVDKGSPVKPVERQGGKECQGGASGYPIRK